MAMHRQNRLQQAYLVQQQSNLLNNILDPAPPRAPPSAREERVGIAEQAKDLWNSQLQNLLRNIYSTDWNAVRARGERAVVGLAGRAVEKVKDTAVVQKLEDAESVPAREG